ncbi:MAG: ABC transporter substrate-binding protein [Christensenellales bacterium]|jgi:peptide/nickel transport system substrate-binding protein
MKKLTAIILAIALVALAGCAGTGAKDAAAKDSLIIAIDKDITTLHPSDYASTNENILSEQVYDTLMYLPESGHDFEPRLAETWEVSEDGLSYTFHLRQGIKFHDGSPFTAEDVKFSAELYSNSSYQGAVVDGLSSVEVLDEHTVVLHTANVFSPFLENIATMRIGSKAYHDSASAEDFANKPIGCGPYEFVSHELGSTITLKAYEDYYRGAPSIKNVTFRILADDATIAVSLKTKEIDFVKISETNLANLENTEGIKIMEVPESRFGFISLNHEKEPFSDVRFRQAVAYAIDRQNLLDLAMDGIGTVNSNIISPLRFGYSDDQPKYGYDPEYAKSILADMGITTPYDLGIMHVAEQYSTQAQVIQNDLAAIGLEVKIEVVEFNTLLQNMFNGDIGITTMSMVLEGTTQQYAMALTSDYVGMANNVRYSNPEIDQLFKDAELAIDEDERFEIYNTIFTKVQEEAVFIVLYNTICLYAYNDQLNVPQLPLEGDFYIYDFQWNQ